MVNEKNIHYDLDGRDGRFYKVSIEYSKEEAEELKRAMDELATIKNERRSKTVIPKPKTKKIIDVVNNIDEALKRGFDNNF
jgi:carbamate kinase